MTRAFTLEYWQDQGWYVGRLREVLGVFSQGKTLEELEEKVRDAYELVREDETENVHPGVQRKEIELPVCQVGERPQSASPPHRKPLHVAMR